MGRSTCSSPDPCPLAADRGGPFTAKQARAAGYGYRHLDDHETAGNFERVDHGLYLGPILRTLDAPVAHLAASTIGILVEGRPPPGPVRLGSIQTFKAKSSPGRRSSGRAARFAS